MKTVYCWALVVVLIAPAVAQVNAEMEGCAKPTVIAKGLKAVLGPRWSTASLDQIKGDWATPLEAADCTPAGCRSLEHEGRIISGRRQCSEKIDLDLPTEAQPSRSLTVSVYYSSKRRSAAVAATRELIRAAGVPEPSNAVSRTDRDEHFQWRDDEGQFHHVMTRLSTQNGVWTTFVRVEITLVGPARPQH